MIRGKKKKKKKKKKNDYGEEQSEASYRVLSTSTCDQEWTIRDTGNIANRTKTEDK